jgi:transcriptional regulator with XRE-family HTH domain|tara:strand:- start:1361 stop:1924 length:564 start_codon:yes stop_codon:yes gene_type:complete
MNVASESQPAENQSVRWDLARIADHPMRLARLQLGISQIELAKRAGVNRAAVTAIEDGRTKNPNEAILVPLALGLGGSVEELRNKCVAFASQPLEVDASPAVANLMLIPPYTLAQYYSSFKQWRLEIARTPTALASMLRVNPAVISRYEAGQLTGFPEILTRKLLEAFKSYGMTAEYVVELEKLPNA